MDCKFDQELLSVYVDGVLEPKRESSVRGHLSECEDCGKEVAFFREIGSAIDSSPREGAPVQLIARILASEGIHVSTTGWDTFKLTAGTVCSAGMDGFKIGEEKERMLRRDLPGWITRWVLFA